MHKAEKHSHHFPLVSTDAFVGGDRQAVHDTETNLVWLNFGINNGASFNEVVAALQTTYKGWRLPTEAEVKTLWAKLFDPANKFDPYECFYIWGANKTPKDHVPFLSFGHFINADGYLAHASFSEVGTQISAFTPSKFYNDGYTVANLGVEGDRKYDGSDYYPFSAGGNAEISTLLVKDPEGGKHKALHHA